MPLRPVEWFGKEDWRRRGGWGRGFVGRRKGGGGEVVGVRNGGFGGEVRG